METSAKMSYPQRSRSRSSIGSQPAAWDRIVPWLTVLGSMLLCVLLSQLWFAGQSLRLDEAQSLWQSSHSLERILNIIAQDVHVPLYALILHFWQFFFGNSVELARYMSLGFFLAAIPAAYALGAAAYNRKTGQLLALLFSLSPFLNWYGNEIRMYSLFLLVTVVNQYFFVRIMKNRENETAAVLWTGYAVTSIIGVYVHYFFGFALITQGLFFLFHRPLFPKHTLRNLVAVAILLAIALSPWLLYVRSLGLASNTKPLLPVPTTINLFNTFSQFLFGFQDDHINSLLLSLWPISVLFTFLAVRKHKRLPPESLYFLLSALVPIVLAFVISVFYRPLYLTRYLILSVPGLYLFLLWFFSLYPTLLRRIFTGILAVGMAGMLMREALSQNTPVKENYRDVVAYVSAGATPEDVIVVSAPFTIYPIEYYYRGPAIITTLPVWNRYAVGPIPPFVEDKLPLEAGIVQSGHQKAYLILSYDQGYEKKIKDYFDSHFRKLEERNFSPGLNVYVYQMNSPQVSWNNSSN